MGLILSQFKTEQRIIVCIVNDVLNVISLWYWGVPIANCLQLLSIKSVLFTILFGFLRWSADGAIVMQNEPIVLNEHPIIGILSQEQHYLLKGIYAKENYTSYIASSYVKDVEASGARVVPIMIGKNKDYYRDLMGKINGVLLPGGATYFNQSDGYADAGQHIYEIAKEINDAGDYFPIFGTCLGFELLIILASGRGEPENRESCDAFGNWPLTFTPDFRDSKMFRDIDDEIVDLLEHENITINAHRFCILDKNLDRHGLNVDWRVTSHSVDKNGLKYIASVENKRYPFYGVQFHPEKSAFEWKSKKLPHSQNAVKANRHFMDFFVQECRKSLHTFENENQENQCLIYNYEAFFTAEHGIPYEQCYLFEPRGIVS